MTEESGKPGDISLRNDFDTVVHYGETTIELNKNGSVTVNINGKSVMLSGGDVTIHAPVNDDKAMGTILDLAAAEARKYGQATISLNHLLTAILKTSPKDIDTILSPRIKSNTLLSMLEREQSNAPLTLVPGSEFNFSDEAVEAIRQTRLAIQKWNTDRLFGAELLHSMISASPPRGKDRSATIDYVRMILSNHMIFNAAAECRKLIDTFAANCGEAPVRIIPRQRELNS